MPNANSLTKSAARGGLITILAQGIRVPTLLLQVVILGRLVDPREYGLLAMVVTLTGVSTILRDFGLSTSALRSSTLSEQQRTNLFWLNTASGLVLAIIIFLLARPIAAFYDEPRLEYLARWIAPTYFLSGLTAQFRVAISRSLRFRSLAICDVLPPIAALIAAIPVARAGHGLAALIVLQLSAPIVDLILSVALAKWRPGLPRPAEGMRDLVSFGMGFAGTQLLSYLSRNIDSIAIGRVWGATPLGYYDRAYQLSGVPINQINAPMTKVALPVLSKVVNDESRFSRGLDSAQLLACYITTTVLFVGAGVAVPLIDVFLGPKWAEAAPLFAVLAIGSVFRATQQIAIWLQVAKGAARSLFLGNLIGQPIIIAAICAGLPWGSLGVAIGSAAGNAAFWVFSMIWAGRNTGFNTYPLIARAVRVISCVGAPAGLAAFFICSFSSAPSLLSLFLGISAAIVTLAIEWIFSKRTRIEVNTLVSFIRTGLGRG